jgi:CDP-glucose 4,6-dehydratase
MTDHENLFSGIYKGKRVLVTGHTGFKGSWLALWLIALKAHVAGYSLAPPTSPNLFEILGLENKIKSVISDIRDYDSLKKTLDDFKPQVIFHLAAQPIVRISYKDPRETYETNIMGTVNLLEAVRTAPSVEVVVNVTSDKCYENNERSYRYKETDPLGGYDPYSASKGCSELVTASYRKSFYNPEKCGSAHNVALASARAGNVIGGGDWGEDRLIPDCMRALKKNEPIVLRNPLATRSWQHVFEPLSGYLWLGSQMYRNRNKYCEAWNFGPNEGGIITVQSVVETVVKTWGRGDYVMKPDSRFHEAELLKLDISKACSFLEWGPAIDVTEALDMTVAWYKNYYEKKDDDLHFSLSQLDTYISRARKKNLKWASDIG